jgi:hypothetical protein
MKLGGVASIEFLETCRSVERHFHVPDKTMQTDQNSIARHGDQTAHATGPRTEAGKAISSMNSLKHGLTAKTVVLRGENQADFDRLHEQLLTDHSPAGALETQIVGEIAACLWRLQRARRYESTVLENSSFEVFVSHTQAKGFETLLRYMSAIERQLNRAIVRLRETQSERRKRPEPVKTGSATTSVSTSYPAPQFVSQLTTDQRTLTTALAANHLSLAPDH